MSDDSISYADWEAEMERLHSHSDPGFTARELSNRFGISGRTMRKILKKGIVDGRYQVGNRWQRNAAGQMRKVPVYDLVKPPKGKKKRKPTK